MIIERIFICCLKIWCGCYLRYVSNAKDSCYCFDDSDWWHTNARQKGSDYSSSDWHTLNEFIFLYNIFFITNNFIPHSMSWILWPPTLPYSLSESNLLGGMRKFKCFSRWPSWILHNWEKNFHHVLLGKNVMQCF